ncbi:MAG: hypothetical protein U1F57_06820 [bacterium]
MKLHKRAVLFLLFFAVLFVCSSAGFSQSLPASRPSSPASQPSASVEWRVIKEKVFPFYKVQILTKDNRAMPLGIEGSRAVITNSKGKIVAEVKNLVLEPDPRETIEGWTSGTLLDLDKDGNEDLLLRGYTGGSHCCYSYQIYSLGKVLKKLGDLKLHDCGERIKLEDVNGDGAWEILTCNAAFTYFKDIPYSSSPFPPQVFGLEGGKYVNQDKKSLKVFDEDIAAERKTLQEKGYNDGDALQIVLDYLLSGREDEGWKQFDLLITSPKKESIRSDLKEKWQKYLGIPPESKPAEGGPLSAPRTDSKLP